MSLQTNDANHLLCPFCQFDHVKVKHEHGGRDGVSLEVTCEGCAGGELLLEFHKGQTEVTAVPRAIDLDGARV